MIAVPIRVDTPQLTVTRLPPGAVSDVGALADGEALSAEKAAAGGAGACYGGAVAWEEPPPVTEHEREPDSSKDLVDRARAGDYHAFEELVVKHQARVYAVALGITKNAAEAEEVAQETFLSAFEHLDGFRGDAKFSSWLFRVATNHALMRLRKKRPEAVGDLLALEPRMTSEGASPFAPLSQWARRPDEAASSKEVQNALDGSLAALPEDDRAMLLLRSVDGTSHQELATMFETTVPAVKSSLHRARLQLRALLDQRLTGVLP